MIIRDFTPKDARSCSELIIKSIKQGNFESSKLKESLLLEHSEKELLAKSKKINYFVMEERKKIIGLGGITDEGEIKTVYTDVDFRRKGIGGKIMVYLEKVAKDKGLKKVFLWSSPQAISFYQSKGYKLNSSKEGDTYMEKKIKLTYNKYKFRKYDPIYPKLYQKEEAKIKKVLGKGITIEHVGSTSIPGLGGKGIIDIAIFTSKIKLNNYKSVLQKIGFAEVIHHPKTKNSAFMQKIINYRGKERRVHVHLVLNDRFWNTFIVFRDHLRENKEAMLEYARIKKEGVKIAKGNREKYVAHKNKFLETTTRKAMGRK